MTRAVAVGFGAVFGFAISWGQFTDPDRLREMLLPQDPYLYVMMATAVAIGFVGARLLRGRQARALLPIAGQPAQGVLWSLFTIAAVVLGSRCSSGGRA